MLIYLDTNVYHRPFNDQSSPRIHREAEAFATIIGAVEKGELELLKSEILEFEIEQNKDTELRSKVQAYLRLAKHDRRGTEEQLSLAQRLEKECGFKGRDALHIAAACLGKARYCVSCDDQMVKRVECCVKITRETGFEVALVGPEDLVRILEERKKS
ncbi:MAG: PIN domain protein [Chloroflexi bacterium]|nr:PIN domain protein [Chloroflexota bacterium]